MLLKIWTQREIWLDPLRRVRSEKSLSDVYYRQRNIETRHTLHLYTVHIFMIYELMSYLYTQRYLPGVSSHEQVSRGSQDRLLSVLSLLYCQVYTRFHFLSSDPGAEAGVVRRLRICVCPQCLVALSHVSHMCRDPAQAHLGAPALHHCVYRYEVGVAAQRKQNMQNTVLCDNQFITKN